MKPIFTLLVIGSCCLSASGQKVDLDRYDFTVMYRDLPRYALDTSYHTYSMSLDASPNVLYTLGESNPAAIIDIEGWKRVNGNGHIKIKTKVEDVMVENAEVKERIQVNKDKNGKEVSKTTYYYLQLTFTFAAYTNIVDYKGNSIWDQWHYNRSSKQTYNTQEFSSFLDAAYYLKYNNLSFTGQITKLMVSRCMQQLNSVLTENFGFPERTVRDFMWIVDSKRHPEYDDHRKAWLACKQVMFEMNPNQSLDQAREALKPVIDYFLLVTKRYPGTEKAERKLRYASYFNLSKIYYYLDDPDNAVKYAGMLVMNDFDANDGRALENAALNLKTILNRSKLTTRHFPIDIANYHEPDDADKVGN